MSLQEHNFKITDEEKEKLNNLMDTLRDSLDLKKDHDVLEKLIHSRVQEMFDEAEVSSMARFWISYIDMVDILFMDHVCFNHSLNADLVLPRFSHALIL